MTIENKVVLITGASSGIGYATASALVKSGAKVILGARRVDKLSKLAQALANESGEIFFQKTDVLNRKDIKSLLNLAVEKFGHIDVLYNNAGVMPQGLLSSRDYEGWDLAINTNILGVLNGIGEILPVFKKQQGGLVIATDSVAGHVVYPGSAVYNATKYAVRAIMEGLRQEERENGIRSTIISPGAVRTELVNSVRNLDFQKNIQELFESPESSALALNPEDVANAVLYAIDQPDHVAVSEVLLRPTSQPV